MAADTAGDRVVAAAAPRDRNRLLDQAGVAEVVAATRAAEAAGAIRVVEAGDTAATTARAD